MRASDVMRPVAVLQADDPAEDLVRAFARPTLRAVAVVSAEGNLVGLITDEDLLRAILPPYVRDDPVLARILEEEAAWKLCRHLQGRFVKSVLNAGGGTQTPPVRPNDALIEVISIMAQTGGPAVLVVEDDLVLGVITVDDVLPALLSQHL